MLPFRKYDVLANMLKRDFGYVGMQYKMLPRGLEPRTLRLLAVRSDQLSYKSHRHSVGADVSAEHALTFSHDCRPSDTAHRADFRGVAVSEAVIAQLGERQTEDLEVLGSIPSPGMFFHAYWRTFFRCAPMLSTSARGFGAVGSA